MKLNIHLSACVVLAALAIVGTMGAELPDSNSGDKLTPDQIAAILSSIADNQTRPSRVQPNTNDNNESYQRVYESFARLLRNMSNNSLSNMRRVVGRLNQLVGGTTTNNNVAINDDEQRAQQLIDRLDQVRPQTDAHSLRNLNEDIQKFVTTVSDGYLRNIRRVIERMNKVVGRPSSSVSSNDIEQRPMAAPGDHMDSNDGRPIGFPGWDEMILAFDRIQKSLAQFVRSSTRLVTSG